MTILAVQIPTWFARALGLHLNDARQVEQTRLGFAAGWSQGVILLLLLAAAGWFTYHYWRDGSRPSWWLKGPLVALRLLALAALIVMLAQPVMRLRHVDSIRPSVLLLVDNSQSMNRPDPKLPAARASREAAAAKVPVASVGGMTRLDRANRLLDHAGLLNELAKRYTVRAYSFAGGPRALPLPNEAKKRAEYRFAIAPDAQTGGSTQMGEALRRALEDLAGQPVAGALVLSDGGHNLGEDPLPVADSARQSQIPISALGLGDPTKTKDVALLSVLADDVVRVNNAVTVYAALSQRGYAGKTVSVTLMRGNEVVGRETIRFGPDEQKQEVRFNYIASRPGRSSYTVRIAAQPNEVTAANNQRSFVQTVIEKKLRVLLVESEPRYEYRYLRNAILRDTSLEFGVLLLSNDDPKNESVIGTIPVREFPKDEKTLFEYDIVVLGDVPRSAFAESQLVALRRFVEDRGASLLVIAGERYMPHEFAGTPLEAVLPVVINPSPDPILTDTPSPWQLTPEGKRSPVTQLEDNPVENERVWANLPGMFWVAGVPRAKPGATVLAVHPTRRNADGPAPLVVTQPFGAGKCFMELVDSTYLWRRRVGDRYFYRYWGQVFRSLTPKELPGNSRFVQLNADRSSYRLGEKVQLSARLLNAYYRPIKAASAAAIVKTGTGQTRRVALEAAPGSPGLFTAQFQPDRIGRYEVTLTSPINPQAKASAAFMVESEELERQKPELDEGLLKKVAAAGGGKYYPPDEIAQWMKSLTNNPLTVRSEEEIELWDSWRLLLLFLAPLTLEWFLRKRKGLL